MMPDEDYELAEKRTENEIVNATIREILGPVMEQMAGMIARNTEALQQLAANQQITSDRMKALEQQIRLNTPVTPTQVRYLNGAMKDRSREILAKKQLAENKKAATKLTGKIRRYLLARYGVASVSEIPKYEYPVAIQAISTWNDALAVMDIVRDARSREAGADG